jgi:hypothetical protein
VFKVTLTETSAVQYLGDYASENSGDNSLDLLLHMLSGFVATVTMQIPSALHAGSAVGAEIHADFADQVRKIRDSSTGRRPTGRLSPREADESAVGWLSAAVAKDQTWRFRNFNMLPRNAPTDPR